MDKLLVTGGSGHLGRRVIEILLEQYPQHKIVTTTRTPEKLSDLKSRGVDVQRADFNDESSLKSIFRGVDRALIVSTGSLNPDERMRLESNAVRAADTAGVKHIVYTSMICAAENSSSGFARGTKY